MTYSLEFLEKVRRLSDADIARLALQEIEREDRAEEILKGFMSLLLWASYLALSAFTGMFAYCCLFEVGGIGGRLAATPVILFWAGITWLALYCPEIWTEDGGGP